MKRTFPLTSPRHKPARVVDSIKSDVRKYLKRERRKPLPEGADFWDFSCRVGDTDESAREAHVKELSKKIDNVVERQQQSVYVEIIAIPGHRKKFAKDDDAPTSPELI